ncbi:MAG: transcriptional regulator [Chitinophagaceae bacterium]|jgi:CheY-like chemotaxis protein|nr:transcriptional regulator [Chitinophagaceae bacterium]
MQKFAGLDCILLIDDDVATNYINSFIIRNAGIDANIEVMQSAVTALDFLSCKGDYSAMKQPPCPGLILLDINMPVMTGWDFMEAYEKLPEEEKGKYVIVMLSSSLNPEDVERAEGNQYIAEFLHKPLEEPEILALVQKLFPPAG